VFAFCLIACGHGQQQNSNGVVQRSGGSGGSVVPVAGRNASEPSVAGAPGAAAGGGGADTLPPRGAAGGSAAGGSAAGGSAAGTLAVAGAGGSAAGGGAGMSANSNAGAGGSAGSAAGAGGEPGGAGRPAPGDCSKPPAASPLVGWATVSGNTDGGGSSAPMMITTFDALKSAAAGSTAATLWIKGSLKGDLTIGSNKTLVGLCGAELHGHIEVSGSNNVIMRNLKIVGYAVGDCKLDPSYDSSVGCSSGKDAITVQNNAHHIWIDHCDISDGTDGNLDITNGANYITVSWTKFHYTPRSDSTGSDSTGAAGHRFSNLVGGTDTPKTDDANALNVTWHHDWWADNVVERQPRVRFGKNHLFNDLWTSQQSSYCVRAGKQAQILIENSVFDGVKTPQQFNNSTDQGTASITGKGNSYTNTSGEQATGGGGTAFTMPMYSYTPDSTSGLAAAIRSGAGPQ
jgi:pectate lyase